MRAVYQSLLCIHSLDLSHNLPLITQPSSPTIFLTADLTKYLVINHLWPTIPCRRRGGKGCFVEVVSVIKHFMITKPLLVSTGTRTNDQPDSPNPLLGSTWVYAPLASQSPYSIIVYSVVNTIDPILEICLPESTLKYIGNVKPHSSNSIVTTLWSIHS